MMRATFRVAKGRKRRFSRRAPSLGGRPAAACRDHDRGDSPARVAATVSTGAPAARPAPRADLPGVSEPSPGAAVSPSLADLGDGPWAAASAEAALRLEIGVP